MNYHHSNLGYTCDGCLPALLNHRDGVAGVSHSIDDPDETTVRRLDTESSDNVQEVTPAKLYSQVVAPDSETVCEDNVATTAAPHASTPKKRRRTRRKNARGELVTGQPSEPDKSETTDCKNMKVTIHAGVDTASKNPAVKYPPREPRGTALPSTKSRDKCLIVLNIPEADSAAPQERLDHDVQQLWNCFRQLFVEGDDSIASSLRVVATYRLGGKSENPAKQPRPLKVGALNHLLVVPTS